MNSVNNKTKFMNDNQPIKRPLNDIPLEEAVLGALLLQTNAIEKIIDLDPQPEWFDKSKHKLIFASILELFENQNPIDLLTVTNKLREKNQLDEIGGAYALVILTSNVAASTNVKYHITLIAEYYHKRVLAENAYALYSGVHDTSDKDSSYYLERFEENISKLVLNSSQNDTIQIALSQDEILKEIDEAKKIRESKGLVGLPSGIKEYDDLTGGFREEELTFIGARPSHGKTNIFGQIASLSCKNNEGIFLIFSMEMSKNKLGLRLNCFAAGEPFQDFLTGGFTAEQRENLVKFPASENIFINDKTNITTSYMRKTIYLLSKKYKILGVGIDYIQMLKDVTGRIPRHQFLEVESYNLKFIAKEFKIPVIALVQTNRKAEERQETHLADLKESAGMEQAADVVIFLECLPKWGIETVLDKNNDELPTVYKEDGKYVARHRFNVEKNRNGAVRKIIVSGELATGRYWSENDKFYLNNMIGNTEETSF